MGLPSFITNPDPKRYLSNSYITLDLETSNHDFGDARNSDNYIVFGVAHGPGIGAKAIHALADLYDLGPLLYAADFVVCQNTKFEIKWLIRAGVDVEKILFYDTMLGDYVRSGNRKWRLDLDSICERYGAPKKGKYISDLMALGICPSEMPWGPLTRYCKQDVRITEQVMLKQRRVLLEEGLLPVFFIRNITTPAIADMEMRGMFLDKEEVKEAYEGFVKEHQEAIRELDKITGGINMASSQQVAEFLYSKLGFEELCDRRGRPLRGAVSKKFPEGNPKTDEDTIKKLKPKNKTQEKFLELKLKESSLRKKITGYCEQYMYICGLPFTPLKEKKKKQIRGLPGSCTLRGDFNQTITDTHRLSSSGPNLQNQDRELKKVFTARKKGWGIRATDYAGLEYRVAGILAKDEVVKNEVAIKFDVHSYTASVIFAKEWIKAGGCRYYPDGTKNDEAEKIRTEAKPDTFGPLYGKVSGTEEQKAYFKAFKEKYHQITSMQLKWIDEVLETQKLKTVTGLTLYFPGTKYSADGWVNNSTNIKNYQIQMFATGDIAPTGVALLWHNMKARNLNSFLIAQIHDSALTEEDLSESKVMDELTVKCMTQDIVPFFKQVIGYDISFIPLEVENKVATHWS